MHGVIVEISMRVQWSNVALHAREISSARHRFRLNVEIDNIDVILSTVLQLILEIFKNLFYSTEILIL